MDIISFALGIILVVVVTVVIGTVYSVVKVKKIIGELEEINRDIANNNNETYRAIDDAMEDVKSKIVSQLDSRFDKLKTKGLIT